MTTIDLNSDVGESFGRWALGNDAEMLQQVTSANVACGFHAGDPTTLRRTCELAVAADVVVGAQPSYRDLAGFGRRFVDIDGVELTDEIVYQVGALDAIAKAAGTSVRYVKPHGALNNAVVWHEAQAEAVVMAVRSIDANLPILGQPNSALLRRAAAAGLRAVVEAFADRGYAQDGTLVPRSQPGAVLHDPDQVADRVDRLVTDGRLRAVDGTDLQIRAESICVHGDTPEAVQMAIRVRAALQRAGVAVRAFR